MLLAQAICHTVIVEYENNVAGYSVDSLYFLLGFILINRPLLLMSLHWQTSQNTVALNILELMRTMS